MHRTRTHSSGNCSGFTPDSHLISSDSTSDKPCPFHVPIFTPFSYPPDNNSHYRAAGGGGCNMRRHNTVMASLGEPLLSKDTDFFTISNFHGFFLHIPLYPHSRRSEYKTARLGRNRPQMNATTREPFRIPKRLFPCNRSSDMQKTMQTISCNTLRTHCVRRSGLPVRISTPFPDRPQKIISTSRPASARVFPCGAPSASKHPTTAVDRSISLPAP